MKPAVHLFLFTRGVMLPRWRDAFKGAKGGSSNVARSGSAGDRVDLVWLRIDQAAAVSAQMEKLPPHLADKPLVVLSDDPSDDEGLTAIGNGARGYCNSHAAPSVLHEVAEVVLAGGLWIGESLMNRLISALARCTDDWVHGTPREGWEPLNERQREIASLVCRGLANREIADSVGATEQGVKLEVRALLDKLGVADRLQLWMLGSAAARTRVVSGRSVEPVVSDAN